MSTYPDYVYQMLARARDEGQWYCGQSDAAGICFDVLALFPDCEEAKELVELLHGGQFAIAASPFNVGLTNGMTAWQHSPGLCSDS